MEETFKSFCAFGSGNNANVHMMGTAKFAKFSRDIKLLDKQLTPTDVDIIFSKVKNKNEQKINYGQFVKALKIMSEKKYPDDPEGMDKLEKLVVDGSGRPKTSKTTRAAKTDVVDRLTDSSKYTGSHKERFDESGKGKGLSGRYDVSATAKEGYVGGYKGMDTYDTTH